ncbi:unnamed protein product [Acanthoscelides obtectus]|uniref:Enoyl-CoA hydratase n=1 Tax=Acanthoscelides obtectus TaxID=200917 RepID=A0A9P0LX12_ACAOB|nr:unnamed protein product [Acanthoscelides obtectus]CAK1632803.1 Enoyl-CoA delta isomerase 2, mitochondrial [Acanthoscelides obtectus]
MEEIVTTCQKGVRIIKLNRPGKKNAMSPAMYKQITELLNEDSTNDSIVITIITGNGDYFSSGNDMKLAMELLDKDRLAVVEDMVNAFISYPKPVIAIVNGPAIGIGATVVACCDVVYASDTATFSTPFVHLGLVAESTASFSYPFIMGRSKASEMLLLGEKLTAQEAYHFGLVSKIIPKGELESFIQSLYKYGELPLRIVKANKKIIMQNFKDILCECNKREIKGLQQCMQADDFAEIIMRALTKKSKL